MEVFQKDDEWWAVVCRSENKFMKKRYTVKFSEIFSKVDKSQSIENFRENKLQNQEKATQTFNGSEETLDFNDNLILEHNLAVRRPTRAAALKARAKWNEGESYLLKQEPTPADNTCPSHGWSYENWIKSIEEDSDYELIVPSYSHPNYRSGPIEDSRRDIDEDANTLFEDLNLILENMRDTVGQVEDEEQAVETEMLSGEVFQSDTDPFMSGPQNLTLRISPPYRPKTSSVGMNVFANGNSRPSSVDYYCTPNIFKHSSLGVSDLAGTSTPPFTRVPLESTPLTTDGAGVSEEYQDNYGSVSLRHRGKRINYALFHRTGHK